MMRKVAIRLLMTGAVLGLTGWVCAQTGGETMPINMSVTYAFEEELDNASPIGADVWEFAGDTGYTMYEEEDYRFDLGVSANVFVFDLQDAPSFLGDITTYSLRLPITAAYTGVDDWTFALTATPGLFWDFHGMDSEDHRMEYRGVASYQVNEALSLTAGADYEAYFDANRVTPVLGFEWQMLEEVSLKAMLVDAKTSYRVDARLTLQASECVNIFAMMQTAGDQWNLEIEGSDYDFFYQATRYGLGVEIGIGNNMWLEIIGGMEANRDAQVKSDGVWVLDDEVDNGPFARVGLTIK